MKVSILSDYLSSLDEESLTIAALFFSNRIFPRGSRFVVNIGFSTIMQVLCEIATLNSNQIQQIYLQHGDLGALSEFAVSKKNVISLFQDQDVALLTLSSVYNQLKKIAHCLELVQEKIRKASLKGFSLIAHLLNQSI